MIVIVVFVILMRPLARYPVCDRRAVQYLDSNLYGGGDDIFGGAKRGARG